MSKISVLENNIEHIDDQNKMLSSENHDLKRELEEKDKCIAELEKENSETKEYKGDKFFKHNDLMSTVYEHANHRLRWSFQ